tara:strand:- start:106 stop:327 length:222 start_codon:yes stop_codon:yes gene_type:complete
VYICNCNGLNERAVERAIAEGASTTGEVYRALGCKPQCARCVPDVLERLRAHRNARSAVPTIDFDLGDMAVAS